VGEAQALKAATAGRSQRERPATSQ
jgi:hypothetical protein